MNGKQKELIGSGCAKNMIDLYIEKGLQSEEKGNGRIAIDNFEMALSLVDDFTEEITKFNIYIKLGDIYQLIGNLDKGLSCFERALQVSSVLKDKVRRVDALIGIANSYLYKNDGKTGAKFAEEVNNLLDNMEYTKGKLDISLFWARYYYLNNDSFKAREVCNSALILCGEDFQVQKGKILNILAELHSNLISDEEYLDLLMQAYECFEKTKYTRGIIGILNNIGHVYNNKIQDYEKSLEYFLKVKFQSENSMFVEFELIVYINIGEMYYKCFKYEDALTWLLAAKDKPKGAYPDNVIFYNYVFIALTYLKLFNITEAYNYFVLASRELRDNSLRGTTLINYYNLAALIFSEIGNVEEAKKYSQKALEEVGMEESLLKWDVGTIYEQIKLKEARSETEVLGILEGVKYLLTKYKNVNTLLDIVYSFCLELIDIGYVELAAGLLEEFKHMKSELDIIELKRTYLEAALFKVEIKKLQGFENSLKTAIKIKDYKMIVRIYNSIGDCYLNIDKTEEAINNYYKASENINLILAGTPEEFKAELIKSHLISKTFSELRHNSVNYRDS